MVATSWYQNDLMYVTKFVLVGISIFSELLSYSKSARVEKLLCVCWVTSCMKLFCEMTQSVRSGIFNQTLITGIWRIKYQTATTLSIRADGEPLLGLIFLRKILLCVGFGIFVDAGINPTTPHFIFSTLRKHSPSISCHCKILLE